MPDPPDSGKKIGTAKTLGNPTCEELPIGNGKSVRVKTQPVDLSGLDFKPISKEEISKTREEIRKSWEELDKDIVIGAPAHNPKISTPVGGVPVEDFAKMVAHYVVDELITRLTR